MLSNTFLFGFWGLFYREREPWTYYLYVAFPSYFWRAIALRSWEPIKWLLGYSDQRHTQNPARRKAKFFIPIWELSFLWVAIASVIALEAMVVRSLLVNPQMYFDNSFSAARIHPSLDLESGILSHWIRMAFDALASLLHLTKQEFVSEVGCGMFSNSYLSAERC